MRQLVTPHPLGGCNIGTTRGKRRRRIIAARCSATQDCLSRTAPIVPRAIGLNPSKTIAALAERIAALMD
jgi:cholesterol oxidase